MLIDPSKRWLIFNDGESECAVIYFSDIVGQISCSWGFYSGPDARAGVSLLVEYAALEYAFEELRFSVRLVRCFQETSR